MTVVRCVIRIGTAAFLAGLALAAPHAVAVAAADTGDTDPASTATRASTTARAANHSPHTASRVARQAGPTRTSARTAPRTPRPQVAAASVHTIAPALQQFLTGTADWLATQPPNPFTDVVAGAVYLVRRSLFPASVGVVTAPIVVPLQLTDVNETTTKKLGIYATLGSGSTTPEIFEFDTGGSGFNVAYASDPTSASPWWGDGVVTTARPVSVTYDSGNVYQGYVATAQVSLYAPGGVTPLITTARAVVGQMDLIEKKNPVTGDITLLWGPSGQAQAYPPVDKAFYGDFGLAPSYTTSGITNLLAQLVYTNGVLPGYRLRTDTRGSWLQIGLTAADLSEPTAMFFPMIIDPKAPGYAVNPYSGLRYYGEQLFNATVTISKSDTVVVDTADVGITPDTGAQPTLHNTNRSPLPYPTQYAGIIDPEGNALQNGLRFVVTATTTDGARGTVYDFKTTDIGVDVQNERSTNSDPAYYFNTGLDLFYLNDVIYYFGDRSGGGEFGLVPR